MTRLCVGFALLALSASACARPVDPDRRAQDLAAELRIDSTGMETPVAEAIDTAIAGITDSPDSGFAWGRLGMVLQAHSLFPPAVESYRRAAELAPDDYRWPYLAALALLRDDPTGAIELLERAAAAKPLRPAPRIDLGDALLQLGDLDQADRWYQEALDLDPTRSHALLGRARVAVARGEIDRATEILERAATISSDHGEVHAELARLYRQQDEEELARQAELLALAHPATTRSHDSAIEAMEKEGVSSRAQTDRGLAAARRGQFAEAAAAFRAAVAVQPENARAHANLGGALARIGQTGEALAEYQKALEIDPDDPLTHNNLGLTLAEAGRLDEASEHLEQALEIDPRYAEAHGNLGLVRSRQKRPREAIEQYRRAIEIEPTLVEARLGLGTTLAESGNLEAAMVEWRSALEIEPAQHGARYNLALASARRGDHASAIELLEQALLLAPQSSRFALALAWELATAPGAILRDGARAVELAQPVVGAYPQDAHAADVLAAAWAESGDSGRAVESAERALALAIAAGSPDSQGLRDRLAGYRLGRKYRQER